MRLLFTFALMLGSAVAATEKPLAITPNDPSLKWGPCPEIFPQGCQVTVLHGDPAKGRSDVFLKIPAGYDFPTHSHTSPEHMTLLSGELEIQYKDNVKKTVFPGTYLYGPAKLPHKAHCGDKGECVFFIRFEKPVDAKIEKAI